MKENDKILIKDLSKRQYIPLKKDSKINNFEYIIKFIFVSIICVVIFLISISTINNKNNQLKTILSRKSMDINMNDKNFLEKLKLVLDNDEIFENEMMNKHTTFQLGGPAKFFIKPKSINKITKVILLCKEYSIEYFILGNGSNLLVSDHGYDGLIINIHEENFSDLKVEEIDETHNKVIVGGGMLMRTLAKKMCLLSLSGLEDIIDIPGTIGGGIIMNASAGGKGLS